MAAYMIAEIDVTDPQAYEAYRAKVPATLAQYGGTYIVRGGALEALEGETAGRIVVVQFESMAALKRWYDSPEYAAIKGLRHAASEGRIVAVEGL
jgi:uncharacterized protein (DUF1330 family)